MHSAIHFLTSLLLLVMFGLATTPAISAPGDIAIVIANKTYRGGVPNVEYADRDADAFAKAAREVLQIGTESILRRNDLTSGEARSLVSSDGTPGDDLVQLVRRARSGSGRGDGTIYFYYSGHGMPGQLVLHDLPPTAAAYEGLSIEALKKALVRLQQEYMPLGTVVLMLDACFSGKIGDGSSLLPASSMVGINAARIAQRADQRMVILTASAGNEVAWWDTDRKFSAFTDALVDGLYGAAAGPDGRITARGLHAFVTRRVDQRLSRLGGGRKSQTPELITGVGTDGSFVLALLRQPHPLRDPEAAARERAQCVSLPSSRDVGQLRGYLNACRAANNACQCEQDVQKRLGALEDIDSACRVEGELLAAYKRHGANEREAIAALERGARCPAVRTEAAASIAVMDRTVRDADAMRRADEAAEEARRRAQQDQQRREEEQRAMDSQLQIPTQVAPACGWYAIMFCDRDLTTTRNWRNGVGSGQVINTSSTAYPRFAGGWFCVAIGPKSRQEALMIADTWKSRGAPTAYAKSAC